MEKGFILKTDYKCKSVAKKIKCFQFDNTKKGGDFSKIKFNNLSSKLRAETLKRTMGNNQDIIIREIKKNNKRINLLFIDVITDNDRINDFIIKSLDECNGDNLTIDKIKEEIVAVNQLEIIEPKDCEEKIYKGNVVLFLDEDEKILSLNVPKFEKRNITEPQTSVVVKGPREGFTESIKVNISLIRKRLLTNKFRNIDLVVGKQTRTSIKVCYLKGIADDKIVKKIVDRIKKIKIDGILDSFYISNFLEERPYSIFRQIGSYEKPDIIVAKMLEGRISILVDGSPMVLTLPFLLWDDIQSSGDYYIETHRASVIRIIRVFGILVSVLLPGVYVAMELFHYKIMPLNFLITIINTTQNLPLKPFMETLIILILYEILYEASIRMPKYVGMSLSIIGALVLGDTAVKAGIISPPGVLIVAISTISVYITPDFSPQIFTFRFLFLYLGAAFGFFGIIIGGIALVTYLADLDNYGTPFLAPLSPYVPSDMKDFIIKNPVMDMGKRPKSFPNFNEIRQRTYIFQKKNKGK